MRENTLKHGKIPQNRGKDPKMGEKNQKFVGLVMRLVASASQSGKQPLPWWHLPALDVPWCLGAPL